MVYTLLGIIGVGAVISGYYAFWRAEHPHAKTREFFIPKWKKELTLNRLTMLTPMNGNGNFIALYQALTSFAEYHRVSGGQRAILLAKRELDSAELSRKPESEEEKGYREGKISALKDILFLLKDEFGKRDIK